MYTRRILVGIFVLFFVSFFRLFITPVYADGTYANIGTATGTNGAPDAVSWSQGYPIAIDSYGHYMVPILPDGTDIYNIAYSNDAGATWSESTQDTGNAIHNRTSMVYDPVNDKLHVIEANSGAVKYRRFLIRRNSSYQITAIVADPTLTPLTMDSTSGCTSGNVGNPIALFKDNGSNGILVAFWSIQKTGCSGSDVLETRASMRTLSNTSADGTASNWKALNGSTDEGTGIGPAIVDYNKLYTASSTADFRQQSAMIRGGSGSKANDIYYFNVDKNDTNGFRRLAWNSTDWSGTWTSRTTFGGDVNDSEGYNLKIELLSKPVYASGQGKVYVGIARWLDNTNGDTQSLYSVDDSDTVSLVSNIYSAGGTHCIYPTFDLAYDSNQNKLYFFYLMSGSATVCGNVYYKTYDGSSFGSETPFFTVANRSVDIPITYQSRYDDKILLFFRVNNSVHPGSSPHAIDFGYVSLNSTATNASTSVSSPISQTAYSDFDNSCSTLSSTHVTNESGGEVGLASSFQDDFETPRSPYKSLFADKWTTGVFSAGTYEPQPTGTLLVYNSAGGAYALGQTSFTKKIMDFRAKFTAHNFQHIGWANSTDFNQYIIFSTMNNGQLNARVENGSGETNAQLGSSYLGSFHNYRIVWGTDVKFYIDDFTTPVATINVNYSGALKPILSNSTSTSGSDLTLDWLRLNDYPTTTGTYISCPLDSGNVGTVWGTLGYGSSEPSGTSLAIATRTSSDNSTWSSWSSDITNGNTVSSSNNRYLQYRVTLNGTSTTTSSFTNLSLNFASPTPTPTNTPTPTTAPSSSGSSSSSDNSSSGNSNTPQQCSAGIPGSRAPEILQTIPLSSTEIKLYFTDSDKPITQYSLVYGTENNHEQYGQNNIGPYGTREYTVSWLAPGTTYYFKVQGKNDCAPGPWSNTISATTKGFLGGNQLVVTNASLEPVKKPGQIDVCEPYTVQSGDTLWNIVGSYLKDYDKVDEVINLNKNKYPTIADADLHVGWNLTLKNCSKPDEQKSEEPKKTYDLQIQVLDEKKEPVAGATVELHSKVQTAKTDVKGVATFKDVEQGEHKVVIAYNNYSSEQKIYLNGQADEYKLSVNVKPVNPFLDWRVLSVIGILLIVIVILSWRYRVLSKR